MPTWAEYARYVSRRWWFVVAGVVGGLLTVVTLVASIVIPTWLGVAILVAGLLIAQFLAFKDMRDKRDQAQEKLVASRIVIGPSPFPRSKLESAVVRSLGAFEKVGREAAVQGDAELFARLMKCAGDVDIYLREADAGDLYERFREDGLRPPHNIREQHAYIKRQIALFESALRELRRDERGALGARG